jgi:tetratricopeptide (TPR) repeat protein
MKKAALIMILLFISSAFVRAEYLENLKEANMYYKLGEYNEAIRFYINAYREKPNPKLRTFIINLKKKIEMEEPALPEMRPDLPPPSARPNGESATKWIVIGADIITTCFAVYFYTEADRWGKLEQQYHDEWWNGYGSTDDAFEKMAEASTNQFTNVALFIYVGGAAIALLGHTVVDMFLLHGTFPQELKTAVIPEPNGVKLSLSYNF